MLLLLCVTAFVYFFLVGAYRLHRSHLMYYLQRFMILKEQPKVYPPAPSVKMSLLPDIVLSSASSLTFAPLRSEYIGLGTLISTRFVHNVLLP